jgi:predicted phage terminase large subunit-like protein
VLLNDLIAVFDGIGYQAKERPPPTGFRRFVADSWSTFDHARYVPSVLTDCICDHVEAAARGECPRLIINVPRGSSKTNIVGVQFPAWLWTFRPTDKVIYGSHSLSLSYHTTNLFQKLIGSDYYKGLAPHVKAELGEWSKGQSVNTLKGERIAVSKSSGSLGRHGNVLLIDDLSNPNLINEASSGEMMIDLESAFTWFEDTISGSLLDDNQSKGIKIIIMQRLHSRDLTGRIVEKYGNDYTHVFIPQFYSPKYFFVSHVVNPETGKPWMDWRTSQDEVSCPERRDLAVCLRRKEERSERAFLAQEQQQPTDSSYAIVKSADIQYWAVKPDLQLAKIVVSIDPTFADSKGSDYCAIAVVASVAFNYYVLDLVRKRMTFTQTLAELRAICGKWEMAQKLLVEKSANGNALADTLSREHGFRLSSRIELVDVKVGKSVRLESVSPIFEQHRFFLPNPIVHDWSDVVADELVNLGSARNDDAADAVVQALRDLSAGNYQTPLTLCEPAEDNRRFRIDDRPHF